MPLRASAACSPSAARASTRLEGTGRPQAAARSARFHPAHRPPRTDEGRHHHVYGDRGQTTTGLRYDDRRRLRSVQTYRAPDWSATPTTRAPGVADDPTRQLLLQDEDFTYEHPDQRRRRSGSG